MRRTRRLTFSSFGVPIAISYPRDFDKSLQAILSPARERVPASVEPRRILLERRGEAMLLGHR